MRIPLVVSGAIFVFSGTGCSKPVQLSQFSVEVIPLPDDVLYVRLNHDRPSAFWYFDSAQIRRRNDVIYLTFTKCQTGWFGQPSKQIPGVLVDLFGHDREVILSDGKEQRSIWNRTDNQSITNQSRDEQSNSQSRG